ncbi:MAG TPA: terpene synthase family protein [Puia sp.]|jgi:hypothetical protein|nr:terpene synthase family protein [Puia sp.]
MKNEQNVQEKAFLTMQRMRSEYEELVSGIPMSLEALLSPKGFRFDQFCREFNPHPDSEELKMRIQEFGEANGCWLPSARHHISCALYLYPTADTYRMFCMMKNLTLGFYLNDVMGRDTFKFLPADEQIPARQMILRMARIDTTLRLGPDAGQLERVNAGILQEFKDHSPQGWFEKFLEIYSYHIGITHTNGDVTAQGRIPGITEYMDYRCHLGGVHHILMWIEFSDGQFLDWERLQGYGLAQPLKRLHWVTAAFAGLSNDLFSLEKEVIDHSSDSNLVMIIALNDEQLSLKAAILRAADNVRNLLMELLSLLEFLKKRTEELQAVDRPLASQLKRHRDAIVRCVQAIWLWHCYSGRYKRPVSLWVETTAAVRSKEGQPSSAAVFSDRG